MVVLFYILFLLINLLLYIFNKNSRLLGMVSVIFVSLFSAGVQNGYDYLNYLYGYNNITTISATTPGYILLSKIGNIFGLNFQTFYFLVQSGCILLIFHEIRRLKSNTHLCLVTVMLYFFTTHTQLKNLIALTILICSLNYLIQDYRSATLKYTIGVCIAAQFHVVFYAYLLLIIVKFTKQEKIVAIVSKGVILLSFALWLFKMTNIVRVLLMKIDFISFRYIKYLQTTNYYGFLPTFFICVEFIFLSRYYRNAIQKKGINLPSGNSIIKYSNMMIIINQVSAAFLPLILMNATPYRLFRNLTFCSIIIFGQGERYLRVRERMVVGMGIFLMLIIWFIFDIVLKGYWSNFFESFVGNAIFTF